MKNANIPESGVDRDEPAAGPSQPSPTLSRTTAPDNHLVDIRWPAERFYWAVVDLPGNSLRAGPVPMGLLMTIEDQIPHPISELHAVAALFIENKAVICAAPLQEIEPLRTTAASLTPEHLPSFLATDSAQDAITPRLNLLVGRCEPHAHRQRRLRTHARAACVVLACALLLSIGLYRRAGQYADSAREAAGLTRQTLETYRAGSTVESLVADLTRLKSLHRLTEQAKPSRDITPDLASILSAWPISSSNDRNNPPPTPQSVSISTERINISLLFTIDPSSFLASFKSPQRWRLTEPRLTTQRELTRVELTMLPAQPSGSPAMPTIPSTTPGEQR